MSDTLEAPKTEPGKGLAIIADLTPEIFTAEKAQEIVASLRAEVLTIDRDVSTKKGREAIASMAAKIARSKTAADTFGKNLKAEYKVKVDAIDGIRRIFWDGLEALQKEFRQPLTEFEEAEKARVAAHESALAGIPEAPGYGQTETAAEIAARLEHLHNYPARDWQEFRGRAEQAIAAEIARTEALLEAARQREAERAELERLRREAAEREAREAQERAEREQREREARAAEEARRQAERAAAAELERVEREKQEAERRAAQAEADRVAAEQRAQQQAEEAARKERERIEAERRAEEDAARKREANRAHRAAVNNAAVAALVGAGLSEGAAKTAVTAIAKGDVPRVSIAY